MEVALIEADVLQFYSAQVLIRKISVMLFDDDGCVGSALQKFLPFCSLPNEKHEEPPRARRMSLVHQKGLDYLPSLSFWQGFSVEVMLEQILEREKKSLELENQSCFLAGVAEKSAGFIG